MKIYTEKGFDTRIYTRHKNCNMDSDTIEWTKYFHIERIICYDHNKDWYLALDPKHKNPNHDSILLLNQWN